MTKKIIQDLKNRNDLSTRQYLSVEMDMEKIIEIKKISNYYGGLLIKKQGEKFYWGIENYDGTNWDEIDEKLFKELLRYKV